MKRFNLLCLPFAGGSKYSYTGYSKYCDRHINLIPLELPGRGARLREKLLDDINNHVVDLMRQVREMLHEPYAIYGHSMGTVLGFLMARTIVDAGLPPPAYLFMTGRGAPSVNYSEKGYHKLPRAELITSLKDLGGCPEEILNDPTLMEIYEPVLRSDFRALADYTYIKAAPLTIPIMVMIGRQERVTYQEALLWQQETTCAVEVKEFDGNHFFIYNYEEQIMRDIAERLLK